MGEKLSTRKNEKFQRINKQIKRKKRENRISREFLVNFSGFSRPIFSLPQKLPQKAPKKLHEKWFLTTVPHFITPDGKIITPEITPDEKIEHRKRDIHEKLISRKFLVCGVRFFSSGVISGVISVVIIFSSGVIKCGTVVKNDFFV